MRIFDQRMKERGYDDTVLGAKVGKTCKTIYNYRKPTSPTTPDHPTALLILKELGAESWAELMREVEQEKFANA